MTDNTYPKIIANWKMNGNKSEVISWLKIIRSKLLLPIQSQCLFCPPLGYLDLVQQEISKNNMGMNLGAQNFDADSIEPLTGGFNGPMLKDLNCQSVIIGHSERRIIFRESNDILLKKILSAIKYNFQIIYCVGETLEEKNQDLRNVVIKKQLEILKEVNLNNVVVAYEPVWAIGSGQVATNEYIEEVHSFIKDELKSYSLSEIDSPVLYGGSVNLENSSDLSRLKEVNGLLIGGASLDANIFSEIVNKLTG